MGKATLLSDVDAVFGFCHEKIPGKGEDSWCYSFNEDAGILGAFDGCGGLGAATYAKLKDHTGAYLASRAASSATMQWFESLCNDGNENVDTLKVRLTEAMSVCVSSAEQVQTRLRGSMVRLMPTTLSIWLMVKQQGKIYATSISAGDSRTYLLDQDGLAQISADDIDGEDAMSNIYHDGVMTNVVAADGDFTLATSNRELKRPCILISATDGSFGYVKSPMEFEYILLKTMALSQNIDQWNDRLQSSINEIAGDDQTMAAAVIGFGSFGQMQRKMKKRLGLLESMLSGFGDDIDRRQSAWEEYKINYYRLAEGGIPSCE